MLYEEYGKEIIAWNLFNKYSTEMNEGAGNKGASDVMWCGRELKYKSSGRINQSINRNDERWRL